MRKILLALTLLGAGGGAFLTARQSTMQLQQEANVTREAWLAQTQLVAIAQSDQAGLTEHIRELKRSLAQPQSVGENALWSALQANRAGHLTPELRERLFEELGFNWQSSEDFIMVSKETVRDIQMEVIRDGKLTEIASTVLALTPGERSQVEAVMHRVQTDFNDWARAHTERSEPTGEVVAQYTLHNDTSLSVSNRFAAGLLDAVGKQRAELILSSAPGYLLRIGLHKGDTTILIVKRYPVGNEARLRFQISHTYDTQPPGPGSPLGVSRDGDVSRDGWFPPPFRPIFPNGWADVAKREGFELPPEESQEK